MELLLSSVIAWSLEAVAFLVAWWWRIGIGDFQRRVEFWALDVCGVVPRFLFGKISSCFGIAILKFSMCLFRSSPVHEDLHLPSLKFDK